MAREIGLMRQYVKGNSSRIVDYVSGDCKGVFVSPEEIDKQLQDAYGKKLEPITEPLAALKKQRYVSWERNKGE